MTHKALEADLQNTFDERIIAMRKVTYDDVVYLHRIAGVLSYLQQKDAKTHHEHK